MWGGNENGEIGLGKVNEQHYPKLIALDFPVGFVACGYYHTAIVSSKFPMPGWLIILSRLISRFDFLCLEKGRVYTCGSNENSQLGHTKDNRKFNEVEGLDEPIRNVSCGGHHTVLVSTSKYIYIYI